MFDFFIDTYKEIVKGEDVEAERREKIEKEKAEKIIYPKDVKIITYVFTTIYILSGVISSIATIKFQGFNFSVISTIFLSVVAFLIIFFLSRKTKTGELTAIALSIVFAFGLYGTTMLSPLFMR